MSDSARPLHWDEVLTDNTELDKYRQCRDCVLQSDGTIFSNHYQKGSCAMYSYPQSKPTAIMLNQQDCPFRQVKKSKHTEQALVVSEMIRYILDGRQDLAKECIEEDYPFVDTKAASRRYSDKEKFRIFVRDGFIDRYSGKKLVNPGVLKCLSVYFPREFPYHPHWKMDSCHAAYWELLPTIDHICPVARGGEDKPENWVCTSMLNNSIKSNWTLGELRWSLCPPGNCADWDGLTGEFLQTVEKNPDLMLDSYIKKWYRISKDLG